MTNALHDKYRPQRLDEVLGQDLTVRALDKIVERNGSHAFLFAGPSGCGKTTLAKITANKVGCKRDHLLDISGSVFTGVEDMRQILDTMQFKPLGGDVRATLIDECHMLSRNAWNSLLTMVEQPPKHAYWLFCTTEPEKVPKTIHTRCCKFTLKAVPDAILGDLYDHVCVNEDIDLPSDIGDLIIREAYGSPRQMLVNLEVCRAAKTRKEAANLLESAVEEEAVIELCKFLLRPGSWASAMKIVERIERPEGARIILMNWMGAASKSQKDPSYILSIMEAFASPYTVSEARAQLVLSVGRALFGSKQ